MQMLSVSHIYWMKREVTWGNSTRLKGSVTRTPTSGRYVGMGERDEDADKGDIRGN